MKKLLLNVLICSVCLSLSQTFALPMGSRDLDEPPIFLGENSFSSNKASVKTKNPKKTKITKTDNVENKDKQKTNPLYPAKYTPDYIAKIKGEYTCSAKNENAIVALDMLKDTTGEFSRKAILGNNLSGRPVKIEFKDLSTIRPEYDSYDALGWKKGKTLYIFLNQKHINAPSIALAPLLAHEALHQDEFNSLAEETYAWTMEAAVWCEMLELHPEFELGFDPLIQRENTLKKLFERGNYTNKYIRKTVLTNDGYKDLPQYSPGFERL